MNPIEAASETRVAVSSELDIVTARMRARALAAEIGFAPASATMVATAISELARNILLYADRGEVLLSRLDLGERHGLAVVARDEGPGIPDISRAMQDGYSTSGRLGLGLPGVRRLMDEFEICSRPGDGTVITVKKWSE